MSRHHQPANRKHAVQLLGCHQWVKHHVHSTHTHTHKHRRLCSQQVISAGCWRSPVGWTLFSGQFHSRSGMGSPESLGIWPTTKAHSFYYLLQEAAGTVHATTPGSFHNSGKSLEFQPNHPSLTQTIFPDFRPARKCSPSTTQDAAVFCSYIALCSWQWTCG